ncbi:MAG: hypothetical protein JXA95_16600 [Spirochaetales bacterium]|nr:hypothetical protein [Spirochaetales bacterium]
MGKEETELQGELDFGELPGARYFECKEGVIFSLIREKCPTYRISYKKVRSSNRRLFKVEDPGGQTFLLYFTEPFLFSRNLTEIREDLLYNLDYMIRVESSVRAVFGKGCVKLKDL